MLKAGWRLFLLYSERKTQDLFVDTYNFSILSFSLQQLFPFINTELPRKGAVAVFRVPSSPPRSKHKLVIAPFRECMLWI